ncbi:MAG: protein translocase SEC61 complex subunit gamma [Candidatus Poseidoniaceae archaeon]|jgi:protein transport protein SEC61 subunit gamma-like protein|nr:protein translocase SEC61 complex subunit gamma [Candidatus Poseidoniaceae archaeon]
MSDEENQIHPIEAKAKDWQDGLESWMRGVDRRLGWSRILRMARKPTPQEFKQTSIICGIGLFVLGFIGFVILIVMDDFIPWLIHDVFGI